MSKTTNLGLYLYESTDKFNITGSENSLNHNMELIDKAISTYTVKNTKSGSSPLVINNVSSKKHDLSVKLTSDTVTDFTNVQVSRYGINLLDMSQTSANCNAYGLKARILDGDIVNIYGTATGTIDNPMFVILSNTQEFLRGKNYVFTAFPIDNISPNNIKKLIGLRNSSEDTIALQLHSLTVGEVYDIQFRLMLSVKQYECYEPYTAQIETANTEGIIEGLTSVSPITTLLVDTEGININVEYNTDVDAIDITNVKKSFWEGKTINFIGDSITYGTYTPVGGSSPNQFAEKTFCEIACDILGANCRNYGISGTSISTTSNINSQLSFTQRYSQMDDDADLVVVCGGTNDYGTNVKLGSIADKTDISFYGALNVLCNGLQEKYLGKRIVFVTPIHRNNEDANTEGHKLIDYKQAIYDVARDVYGYAVIDGFQMGISCANTTFKNTYIVDGLHPNPEGHEIYGQSLAHALNGI